MDQVGPATFDEEGAARSGFSPPPSVLTGLSRSETTPLVMLTAILALTTAILVGVCFQHPLATPAGIAVAVWLGVVVRALVRRLRVPDQLRGAYAQAGPAGIFASLLDRFESRPVLAVISFAIVSGGAALELGLRVDERTRATNLGFVGLFVSATALGGAIVGAYQLRRARRKR